MRGLLLLLLAAAAPALAEQPSAPAGAHGSIPCEECHPGDGRQTPCRECHGSEANIHPDQVTPSFPVPEIFPLVEGRVSCPSCHRLHSPTGPRALRGFDGAERSDYRDFCFACHGERLAETNPHLASQSTQRCAFCHASVQAVDEEGGLKPQAKAAAQRLCDFCHDMTSRGHPRNIDPVLKLPKTLPRAPNGTVTCISCHSPHGSSRVAHYIREEYAAHYERGMEADPHVNERWACPACHLGTGPENITRESNALRLQGDAILLCVSCHIQARSHHPVGVPLADEMAQRLEKSDGILPVDEERRVTCITCHSNNCDSGEQRRSVRYYEKKESHFPLCWMCHPKEEWAKTDPHRKNVDDTTEGCVFCHDRTPVKGLERSADLYFISDVRMICLRCHERLSDFDKRHTDRRVPDEMRRRLSDFTKETAIEFPLDKEDKITCTTCHNSHFAVKEGVTRTRAKFREICIRCHQNRSEPP